MGLGGWGLSLYPEAGEAGGAWVSSGRSGGFAGGVEPGRAEEEAARRARGKVRRYCAANRLNRFATLTYAGAGRFDPGAVRPEVAEFFRGLRRSLGGERLPYLWVPEWHPGGHGLHVHFAVGRYVPRALIGEAWPHGFVHIKLLGNLPVGSGALAEARLAGRYLAKYVSKHVDGQRLSGLHRYEVAQGFQPQRVVLSARTEDAVLRLASERMGGPPEFVWRSSTAGGWHGPPACWASWNG